MSKVIDNISELLGINKNLVEVVIDLLEEGNTIPFIARYRKEATEGLDEVAIFDIKEAYDYIVKLEERKKAVILNIKEKGKLTNNLEMRINQSIKLNEVENLYKPFIEKKNTLANQAKEKGLVKLFEEVKLFDNNINLVDMIKVELETNDKVTTESEVYEGVKELLKESVVDDVDLREDIRSLYDVNSLIVSKVKDKEKDVKGVYGMYYDYKELVSKIPSHRYLALKRGEAAGVLKISYDVDRNMIFDKIRHQLTGGSDISNISDLIDDVVSDSYTKSLKGSVERESSKDLKEDSDDKAIEVFMGNLEALLLTSPVKDKVILALDPAYRTGCKLAVVDGQGKYLDKGLIYPHAPRNSWEDSKLEMKRLILKHNVNLIVIGNGTASRESEEFVAELINENKCNVEYLIVNEAGASVYSASEEARREFPYLQVEERSAVSIGRRVLDPLSELIKIDPKSIGIGQYQHTVDQIKLNKALSFTVEKVVNRVGVDLNTASSELLSHVSGISKKIAENIVEYRELNGRFLNRKELLNVKGLGNKTYIQSVGFIRVYDGTDKYDETELHVENYVYADNLLEFIQVSKDSIGTDYFNDILNSIDLNLTCEVLGLERSKVEEVVYSLTESLRDIREDINPVLLRSDVVKIEDIVNGMELRGTVRNVVDFGAFVDIGLKNDGLVHISKLSKSFVKHPGDIIKIGDPVTVWVESVDVETQKISLTMLDKK